MSTWINTSRGLLQTLNFANLQEMNLFLEELSSICDKLNHHADIVYVSQTQIDLYLITHDVGKITELDYQLSEAIDQMEQVILWI